MGRVGRRQSGAGQDNATEWGGVDHEWVGLDGMGEESMERDATRMNLWGWDWRGQN